MKNKKTYQSLVDPRENPLLWLFVGVYGLALASTAFSDLIIEYLGQTIQTRYGVGPVAFRIGLFVIVTLTLLLFFIFSNIDELLTKRLSTGQVLPQPLKKTYRGLVVLMSKTYSDESESLKKTPAAQAISHHWSEGNGNLEYCWIICGGELLKRNAYKMVESLAGATLEKEDENSNLVTVSATDNPARKLRILMPTLDASEVNDPNVTFDLMADIYAEARTLDLESDMLIADFTGGTKSMTAGMVLACAVPERQLQYMHPPSTDQSGRADFTKNPKQLSKPMEVKLFLSVQPLRR